ncbi:hypothetical protein SUGI_0351930 [Cryptomeria japonica]|nr:hypothetical protein SUGI_0351930 [Cryptomeria japonica]
MSSIGDRSQPARNSAEIKEEELSVPSNVTRLFAESDNKNMRMVPIRDVNPGEAAPTKSKKALQEEMQDDISDLVSRLTKLNSLRKADEGEGGVKVITLAGENRGATMDFGSENGLVDIHRGYKLNQDAQNKDGLNAKPESKEGTYVNSNVQGINNSIMYNSSCPNRDPGVHMGLSKMSHEQDHGKSPKKGKSIDLKPPEISISRLPPPPDPPVKRRCLRAMFLESSSDSSPERSRDRTPKQRRHGCRYECQGHGGSCKDKTPSNQHAQEEEPQLSADKGLDENHKAKVSCFGRRLLCNRSGSVKDSK